MRKCPKCSLRYDDDRKICRACGAALDDVERPDPLEQPLMSKPPPLEEPQQPILAEIVEEAEPLASWQCPGCGETVPGELLVCWNCGTDEDGRPDPEFVAKRDNNRALLEQKMAQLDAASGAELQCNFCGSKRIIPSAKIIDRDDCMEHNLRLVVYGDPNALLFKNRLFGKLYADVCGDCGHVEIYVENPDELYDRYLQAMQNG